MERIEVWLPPQDRTALFELAAQAGLTHSALARLFLKSALARPDHLLPGLVRPLESHGGVEQSHG
jgi:hypothetical protein